MHLEISIFYEYIKKKLLLFEMKNTVIRSQKVNTGASEKKRRALACL